MKKSSGYNTANYLLALSVGVVALIIIVTIFNNSIGSSDFSLLLQTLAQ